MKEECDVTLIYCSDQYVSLLENKVFLIEENESQGLLLEIVPLRKSFHSESIAI